MPTVHLPKKFGLLNAISINMSNMVGTGPFITVPAILATMGGPQALVCWFVGAVIAIADGLVFAELGTTFPSSGGSYTYLRECFGREGLGRLMAWLFVWQFLFSGTLEIASGTVGHGPLHRLRVQGPGQPAVGYALARRRFCPGCHGPARIARFATLPASCWCYGLVSC